MDNVDDATAREFAKQLIHPKRKSQVRNGSFSAVMALEKQAELEAEYLKLHDMFPDPVASVQEEEVTYFEQTFENDNHNGGGDGNTDDDGNDDDEDEEEEKRRQQQQEKPKQRRGTITRLMGGLRKSSLTPGTAAAMSPRAASTSNAGESSPVPPSPGQAKKRSGSIFARLAGGSNNTSTA